MYRAATADNIANSIRTAPWTGRTGKNTAMLEAFSPAKMVAEARGPRSFAHQGVRARRDEADDDEDEAEEEEKRRGGGQDRRAGITPTSVRAAGTLVVPNERMEGTRTGKGGRKGDEALRRAHPGPERAQERLNAAHCEGHVVMRKRLHFESQGASVVVQLNIIT